MSKIVKDPFRLFFPLGVLFAFLGIFPWAWLLSGWVGYPVDYHRLMMINGFLLAFVCGFLMTAIPRFTQSSFATVPEIVSVAAFLLLGGASVLIGALSVNHLATVLVLISLVIFAVKRFISRASEPPESFVFLPFGIFLWIFANLNFFFVHAGWFENGLGVFDWRDAFSSGGSLFLILGVGSRLIPNLLGHSDSLPVNSSLVEGVRKSKMLLILAILLMLTYLQGPETLRWSLRAAVVGFIVLKLWRLYLKPASGTLYGWSLWFSVWCVFWGTTVNVFFAGQYVHWAHIFFIGGLSLLTLLISFHVVLAHGANSCPKKKISRWILAFTILILFSALTRATAVLWPKIYLSHLSYAAVTWIASLLIWIYLIFR